MAAGGEAGFSLFLYVVDVVLHVVTLCLSCPLDSTGLKCPLIHGFFFSPNMYHSTRLVDSADVELRIWRADHKVYSGFLTPRGLVPLTPVLFKGEL